MSRRKQSNPKPLLKSDCQESAEEMTVEKDNKNFYTKDLIDETSPENIDNSEQFLSDSMKDDEEIPSSIFRSTLDNTVGCPTSIELNNQNQPITTVSTNLAIEKTIASQSKIEKSSSKNDITDNSVNQPTIPVPKLRLNISLASDPALKPEAKDIKIIKNIDIDDNDVDENDNDNNISISSSYQSENLSVPYNKKNRTELITNDDETLLISSNNNCNAIPGKQHQLIAKPSSIDVTHRLKVFMCHPCGIGFSSHSTLEAHQKYYCSHRQEIEDDNTSSNNIVMSSVDKLSSSEPLTKSIKTGKQYACTQCSYSADKKVSLNRHMRMHQSSPAASSNTSNGEESSSQQIDRYCSECDIRFSNVKTYRAHKQHYCSSRRTDGQTSPKQVDSKSGSISPQMRSKTPTSIAPPQPFLALPTNPILIIPYSIVRASSLLPGPLTSVTSGVSNPDTTCFTFENGALHPVATALNTQSSTETSASRSQPSHCNTISPLLSEKNTKSLNNIPKSSSKKEGSSRETVPLDLSVRKSPISFQKSSVEMITSMGLQPFEESKLAIEVMMEGKENFSLIGSSVGKLTPEQIVCSPSLPSSPSMSPSPKRRTSPKLNTVSPISPILNCIESGSGNIANIKSLLPLDSSLKLGAEGISSLLSKKHIELALKLVNKPNETTNNSSSATIVAASGTVNATAPVNVTPSNSSLLNIPSGNSINVVPPLPNVQPQIYVKQGVSKCKECNIVFCKYENYLAHKQHYCSARNQDESEVKVNTPPTTSNCSDSGPAPVSYHQLICAACGIKYTSLDNLRAHQTFYCPKGNEITSGNTASNSGIGSSNNTQISTGKERCNKCKIIHDLNKQCTSFTTLDQNSSYKCPVCGTLSLNATDSRKHLETHGSVKAFRCSICRYKGNTLRGMRTHIRMHFDKKSVDFNEENYMSCILEEESIEISSSSNPINQDQSLQLFNCEICNYSSSYKGNVIRHMKLVHSQSNIRTPSTSPEIGEGNELLTVVSHNGEVNKTNLKESVTIKIESNEVKNCEQDLQPNSMVNICNDEGTSLKKIKIEPDEVTCFSPSPLESVPPIGHQLSTDENSEISQDTQKSNCINENSNGDDNTLKYCRNCDIKFNYVNTYIAHKQFYCKSNKKQQQQICTEIKTTSPVTVVQSLTPITLGNKNKENMETVL